MPQVQHLVSHSGYPVALEGQQSRHKGQGLSLIALEFRALEFRGLLLIALEFRGVLLVNMEVPFTHHGWYPWMYQSTLNLPNPLFKTMVVAITASSGNELYSLLSVEIFPFVCSVPVAPQLHCVTLSF